MLLLLLVAGSALPNATLMPVQANSTRQNNQTEPQQYPHLRPIHQSSPQSVNQTILTYRRSILALSAKKKAKAEPMSHNASKKVEDYAKKLREDMEAQERVLNAFITTIKTKHQNTQSKLSRIKSILKGLKAEIANATKYANEFQAEDIDQSKQAKIIQDEYEKSAKMFSDERENIEFEKKFLEEIIKYIQLRKSNCLTK